MKLRSSIISITYLTVVLFFATQCAPNLQAQVERFTALNSKGDDYATSFRTTSRGVEIWLNTSQGMKNIRSRRMVRALCTNAPSSSKSALEVLPFPINQEELNSTNVYLDGSPTFAACDTSYGIFVSNRLHNGKNYDNDIYEVRLNNGSWSVRRIDELCSEYWDDSPSLSQDGNTLYFASTRDNAGTGLTNIYMAKRTPTGWSAPTLLPQINTRTYKEEAPFLGADSYLYYSTDREGDLDIYRVHINSSTGQPDTPEEPVPFANVNRRGSDEATPSLSAGASWLLFSSNRSDTSTKIATADYDIYAVKIPKRNDTISLTVLQRIRNYNAYVEEYEDNVSPCTTSVTSTDRTTQAQSTFTLSKEGTTSIVLPSNDVSSPCNDSRFREIILQPALPTIKGKEFVAERDTILLDILAPESYAHTMYIWDTSILTDKECTQNFPVTEVQFFLTCYWCPTSLQYTKYVPCQSVFQDTSCTTLQYTKPQQLCKPSGDIYNYQLQWIEPKIVSTRSPGLCIPQKELNNEEEKQAWGVKVDSAIVRFVASMKSALQRSCVQRAIKKGNIVEVEVIGWTDPRGIHSNCLYTGSSINFSSSWVQLADLKSKSSYLPNGVLSSNTAFSKSGAMGNQLLSDVRAYYTAVLLDSVWTKEIPEYRKLKYHNPPLLKVVALGKAIKQESKIKHNQVLDFSLRRSANVIVRTPGEDISANPRNEITGRYVTLQNTPCFAPALTAIGTSTSKQSTQRNDVVTNSATQFEARVRVAVHTSSSFAPTLHSSVTEYINLQPQLQLLNDAANTNESAFNTSTQTSCVWYNLPEHKSVAQKLAKELSVLTGITFTTLRRATSQVNFPTNADMFVQIISK